ncbi:MAG: glucokinase [Gammaproteobacteria bacterium]|nr:glucokinase [Gammaproteobacteria bacterium]
MPTVPGPRIAILAGDIGGTNARFGCYADGERVGVDELDAEAFPNGEELLAAALAELPPRTIDACCLAVAGPVFGDEAKLTNIDIAFSRTGIEAATGTSAVALVNDMVALGSAVSGLPDDRFELLSGGPQGGVKCVLAAGTGLGMVVVADGKCLPSEGGHARIAPVGAFERELISFSESEVEHHGGVLAWEHYLSGRGVEALYRAVCAVWGAKAESLDAAQITRRGLAVEDPVCHTTVETWAGMLATAAGGLAVTSLSFGGVYLGGSIPVAVAEFLRGALFRRRFEDAAWAADYLTDVPIYLIADPLAGLEGAHLIAKGRLRQD